MLIGAASCLINNELGRPIQGAGVNQVAASIRDDLQANALYLASEGQKLLLVSCDLVALESGFVARVREAMAKSADMPPRNILIGATHQHSGPSVLDTSYGKPVDEAYYDALSGWLVDLARAAVQSAQPGRLGWGIGSVLLGYNRRLCWADGSHTMHGDPRRDGYSGLEGPQDSDHLALFARDAAGKLIAVLHQNTAHPTAFYGMDFYSADYPGLARRYLREVLGELPVLFFNGAQGDIQRILPRGSDDPDRVPEHREQTIARQAHLCAGETLRLLHECERWETDPLLAHRQVDLEVKLRPPDPQTLAWAHETLRAIDQGANPSGMDRIRAYGSVQLQGIVEQRDKEAIALHALRIGSLAIVTQPCELFCAFGLDLKRRSPFAATAMFGITDGYAGYCPTLYGVLGGGYSGMPIGWTRLAPEAGYQLVDRLCIMLAELGAMDRFQGRK